MQRKDDYCLVTVDIRGMIEKEVAYSVELGWVLTMGEDERYEGMEGMDCCAASCVHEVS